MRQSTTPFTEDNLVIIGQGTTTDLTGDFKGIVTGKDDTKNEIYVKFISRVKNSVETSQDYTYTAHIDLDLGHPVSIVGAGAGTTSVQVTRGVLGERSDNFCRCCNYLILFAS